MFFGLFKKKFIIVPKQPIVIGDRYILKKDKMTTDPWGVLRRCISEVTDVKNGWVKYFYVYDGERNNYTANVMKEKSFKRCYKRMDI